MEKQPIRLSVKAMKFFHCLLLLLGGNCLIQAAPPPNDVAATAQVLESPLPLTVQGNLAGVTEERLPTGAPFQPHPETMRPASLVWYRWTAPVSGLVEVNVSTHPPFFGYSRVFLFAGNDLTDFTSFGGGGLHWVKAGQLYWLAVGSHFDWDKPVPEDAPFQLKLTRVIPPAEIDSLSIKPDTVDVSENAAVVTVSGVLRHDVTALLSQQFTLCRNWPGRENADRAVAVNLLGNGCYSFSSQITIPRGSYPGDYSFDCELNGELPDSNGSVYLKFSAGGGGISSPYYAEMPLPEVASLPLTVINQAAWDFTPPSISLGTIRPSVVVTDGQEGQFEFEAQIDDDASGFDPDHPGNYISAVSYERYLSFGKTLQQLSGDDRQGRWRWTLPLPRGLPTGSYRLSLCLVDKLGRQRVYSDNNFGDGESFDWPQGLPRTVEVRGSRGYEAWCYWNSKPRPDGSIPIIGPLFTSEGSPAVSNETGLPHLFSYAFNLRSDVSSPGDTSRMPRFEVDPSNGSRLTGRFWRLRSSVDGWPLGLRYQPQFAGNPAGPWLDAPESSFKVELQAPDSEKVIVPDPAPSRGSRFGRVKIEYSAP